ncbi:hypothetical protein GcM1_035002, partial [Golovinomyces cichoracearum]
MHCGVKDPRYLCTDYDVALINAIEYQFDGIKHQICIFHINMNLTLKIKKKLQRPAEVTAAAKYPQRDPPHPNAVAPAGDAPVPADDDAIQAKEKDDHELRTLNAPARNKASLPATIPAQIETTRQGLFDLIKFMEYSP